MCCNMLLCDGDCEKFNARCDPIGGYSVDFLGDEHLVQSRCVDGLCGGNFVLLDLLITGDSSLLRATVADKDEYYLANIILV